ncbi:hypothetical protein TRFO_28707 [Tritrichomonas foetus]|uniref:Uncharacterized protein n=1 Tax=Tritrichomonas foetus TaxID=1144522 RepID=A0A1J4JXQ7_9EUKA|nr:hypothetical protein TRFO_28707 [Tritrichomonas foetus]|eukprot:OHT03929.1 hypothetical protein TRFO_28707 [Tritrichomonas foetus]
MTTYKEIHLQKNVSLIHGDDIDINDEIFSNIPKKNDLDLIYHDVQKYFNEKNTISTINSLEKLLLYLQNYDVEEIKFQNIMFPIFIALCKIVDNDEMVEYSFQFISFIMQKSISLMPLLFQPQFFDFCMTFIECPNQNVLCAVLLCIKIFIEYGINARDYAIVRLSPEAIINRIIENEIYEDDVRNQAFQILDAYTNYPIDSNLASCIYDYCETSLRQVATFPSALKCISNIIKNNTDSHDIILSKEGFPDLINQYTYAYDKEEVYPALLILQFLFNHNLKLPEEDITNFLSLLRHDDFEVCDLAFDCLCILISRHPEIINELIIKGFFNHLDDIFESSPFHVRLMAAKIACLIAENASPMVSNQIMKHGVIHIYIKLLEMEQEDLILRVLKALFFIYSSNFGSFTLIKPEEEEILYDLSNSPSDEISENAKLFIEKFLAGKRYLVNEKRSNQDLIQKKFPKQGPKIRVKKSESEKPIVRRKRMVLWTDRKKRQMSQNISCNPNTSMNSDNGNNYNDHYDNEFNNNFYSNDNEYGNEDHHGLYQQYPEYNSTNEFDEYNNESGFREANDELSDYSRFYYS